jgi:hypothetical protein
MHDLATPMLRDARRAQRLRCAQAALTRSVCVALSYRVLIWFFPLKLYENDSQEKN